MSQSLINQTSMFPDMVAEKERHPAHYVGANHGQRKEMEFYPTPPSLTIPLFQRLNFPNAIWEPACGDGAISRVAIDYGYSVVSTDLNDHGYGRSGVDFFSQSQLPAEVQTIITNPPYKVQTPRRTFSVEDWVAHGYDIGARQMAFLLKTVAIAGQRRSRILQRCQLQWVLQFRARPKKFGSDTETSMIDFAWFVFNRDYRGYAQIDYLEFTND